MEGLNTTTQKIRQRADALQKMLKDYELQLADIPNAAECQIEMDGLILWFHRKGRDWAISGSIEPAPDPGNPSAWRDLDQLSIQNKVKAAKMMIDFPEAIEQARLLALEDLDDACNIMSNLLGRKP